MIGSESESESEGEGEGGGEGGGGRGGVGGGEVEGEGEREIERERNREKGTSCLSRWGRLSVQRSIMNISKIRWFFISVFKTKNRVTY